MMHTSRYSTALAVLALITAAPLARSQTPATLVTGTLLGADGKPMKMAYAFIFRASAPKGASRALVGADGRYAIATQYTGPLLIQFTGVDHNSAIVPLMVERPQAIALDVRLQHYAYTDTLSRVTAIGDWNKFAFGTGKPLERQSDGRYSVTVETSADTLAYQLVGLEARGGSGHSINGQQADWYEYDNGGDYRSVVRVTGGHATIVLDPAALAKVPGDLSVTFRDPVSLPARVYALYHAWSTEERAYFDSSAAARARHDSVHFHWTPALARLRTSLARERDPLLKQMLLIQLVDAGSLADSTDSALCRRFLAEIPASSPWFSLLPNTLNTTFTAYRALFGGPPPRRSLPDSAQRRLLERFEQIAAAQPDSGVQAEALMNAVFMARSLHDDRRMNADYTALVEGHPQSAITRYAKSILSPNRPLRYGVPMPDFRFASLDDSTVTYTPASFAGKVYLVDVWATWCGPCIGEMPYLQALHDSLASRGLEMLSVSIDNSAADVRRFREGQWKLPWLQAFAPGGLESTAMKQFEILAIPTVVLVGRDGKIIAVDEGLRGDQLLPTVRRALETPASQ